MSQPVTFTTAKVLDYEDWLAIANLANEYLRQIEIYTEVRDLHPNIIRIMNEVKEAAGEYHERNRKA